MRQTNWGGYSSNFDGGFTSSIDIYLNVAGGWHNDTRFAWDTAISNNTGGFLRDFVFNAGYYTAGNPLNHAAQNGFTIDAENNTGRAGAYPSNPHYDPYTITSSGWYTFKESFFNNGGQLGVAMSILDSTGTPLHTWANVEKNGDLISSVGGNFYGWFASNEFSTLAFDNSRLTYVGEAINLIPPPLPVPEPCSFVLAGLPVVLGVLVGSRRRRAARRPT